MHAEENSSDEARDRDHALGSASDGEQESDILDEGAFEPGGLDPREPTMPLEGVKLTFAGRLGGVNRKQAAQLVRQHGGTVLEEDAPDLQLIVIGAEESPLAGDELLSESLRSRVASGQIEIIHETELWQRMGLVDTEQAVKRLYTPAMLAHLLGISVAVIRRWHRRGLIIPARTVHRLPYFDFTEVATARRLAELVAAGATAEQIERRLDQLSEVLPDVQRPLAQLSVLIEGQQILLRQGEGLIEPGGQLRIDFDALDREDRDSDDPASSLPSVLTIAATREETFVPSELEGDWDSDPLLQQAYEAEDAGNLDLSIDFFHAMLARDGARADLCFQLGELLYRSGQVEAARERYYMAIELDENFVEARASLGCVLAETGRPDLAIAAFRGTLALHDDYPDVHYNLARSLDEQGLEDEATIHWHRFLDLSPDSPWADEARQRLSELAN